MSSNPPKPLPPGNYEFKLLDHHLEYLADVTHAWTTMEIVSPPEFAGKIVHELRASDTPSIKHYSKDFPHRN